MALILFSGPGGSGKSLLATYLGIEALKEKRNVIANFPFKMTYFKKKKIGMFRYVKTSDMSPGFFVNWATTFHKRYGFWKTRCQTVVIIDEAEMIFNAREWKNKERMDWINFLANHRHMNYDIYLICPMDRMLDRQVRGVINNEYKCRSLCDFGTFGRIVSLLFGKLFVAVPYNYSCHEKLWPAHFYKLHRKKANVYDTMRMFEGMAGYDEIEGGKVRGPVDKKKYSYKTVEILGCAAAMLRDHLRFMLQKTG